MTELSPSTTFLPHDGGELGRLIAAIDWSSTCLGGLHQWAPVVKGLIATILRSPLPIATLWGEDGVLIYNHAYSLICGVRHPTILGARVRDAWPEAADFNTGVVRTVFGRGETLSYKDQPFLLKRPGRPDRASFSLDYSPILDGNGIPLGVIAIVIETTDKVLADRQLAEERLRLKHIYDQSPSIMALLEGPKHRFVLANSAYRRFVGDLDLVGLTAAEVLPDALQHGCVSILDGVYASGEAHATNGSKFMVRQHPNGPPTERSIDFVYQPIAGADGQVNGIFINGVDVTDRVAAQEATSASAAQFQILAQSIPNHVWTAIPNGDLDWFNEQVFEYSGSTLEFPAEETAGQGSSTPTICL